MQPRPKIPASANLVRADICKSRMIKHGNKPMVKSVRAAMELYR